MNDNDKITVHRSEKPVILVNKTDMQDTGLSWAAKGLYAFILSLPVAFSYECIMEYSKEPRDVVEGLVEELVRSGHLSFKEP